MAFTAFRDMKPLPQLMFAVFVILVSFLTFMLISLIVVIPLFGTDSLLSVPSLEDIQNPQNMMVLKYMQVIQAIGLFIIPPFILGWLYYGDVFEYLFLDKTFELASVLLIALLMFFAAPFINFAGEINADMTFPGWLSGVEEWMRDSEEKAAQLTEAFLNVHTYRGLLFNLFMIAFLPAIGEELLFRGVIQRIFTNMTSNHNWGIWISAILFSALHLQFYGFIPRMLLGALFGYLLVWSGSMWLPILAHFLNNGIAVVALFMVKNEMLDPKIEEMGSTSDSYYMAAISFLLIIVFMLVFKHLNKDNQLQLKKLANS